MLSSFSGDGPWSPRSVLDHGSDRDESTEISEIHDVDSEKPRLPTGWEEHFDEEFGSVYYHHEERGITQWEFPMPESPRAATGSTPQCPWLEHELIVKKESRSTIVGVTSEMSFGAVMIADMSKEHVGHAAGLRTGDVLVAVNDQPCVSPEQTSGLLRIAMGRVRVIVRRSVLDAEPLDGQLAPKLTQPACDLEQDVTVVKAHRQTIVGLTTELREGSVTIVDMSKEHAGYAAGLRIGDVVVAVNDQPCVSPEQTSGLLRDGSGRLKVRVRHGASDATSPERHVAPQRTSQPACDLEQAVVVVKERRRTIVGLTTELRKGSVTIVDMSKEHAGYAAGLRIGDVVVAVNDQPCVSPEQTSGLLRDGSGRLNVIVQRP